jgi:hypothetical protein
LFERVGVLKEEEMNLRRVWEGEEKGEKWV